ncbi:MAG TPA: CAP domain-containing protein, partial [Gaiellaceae bacterium]|nr:CAP domain-containing protein [Gaiellaceae bacterium]
RPGGSAAIVATLNAERAANGIPGDVRENAEWSASCADHVAYMTAARRLTHTEDPASPSYTASGSWAAENSVLAAGTGWQDGELFADSPLHLIQLLSPELHEIGVAEDSGYLCITTWPGYRDTRWSKPTVFTYPGDGATGVPLSQRAHELPFTPGDFVGLPKGAVTGFDIMVFTAGLAHPGQAHVVAAALRGPAGRVAVKTVDRTTPTVGPYLPPGSGFVIPVAPLQPGTAYRATVRFAGGPRHTWNFVTADA